MEKRRSINCPQCGAAPTDTVTSAPYVRGFLLGYTYGSKRMVGCNTCVKKQLAGEVGLSMLTGWFSITALLVNPMCILWNGIRLPFLRPDPLAVDQLLDEIGVGATEVDIARVAASLAVAMVAADGKIEQEEVDAAVGIGQQLVEGLTPNLFQEVLFNAKNLPSPTQLAGLLAGYLGPEGKVAILKYLLAIASADGHIDQSEVDLLKETADAFGIELPEIQTGALT